MPTQLKPTPLLTKEGLGVVFVPTPARGNENTRNEKPPGKC